MSDTVTDVYGYPFDSLNGDRKMSASSWRKMLESFFNSGIFSTVKPQTLPIIETNKTAN